MFPGLNDYLDEIENTVESTSNFLRKLNGARTRLKNAIEKAEQTIKDLKDEDKYFAGIKNEIQKDALKVAKSKLFFNAKHAYLVNEEFNEPPYRNALALAITDNDTYMFRRTGSGFSGMLKIDINLDKTAGRIYAWAAGIKAYRKILEKEKEQKAREKAQEKGKRYKKSIYNPILASKAWAGIFESRSGTFSKFQTTIRERLALSGSVAPFWMLLDKGVIPLKSDRGGYPTPTSTETNFVHDTEVEVQDLIDASLTEARKNYYQSIADYNEFLATEKNRLLSLDNLADNIRLDIREIRKLERMLESQEKEISRNKLEKAADSIRRGLLTKGTIDITAKGSKKRTRLSVSTLTEYLL